MDSHLAYPGSATFSLRNGHQEAMKYTEIIRKLSIHKYSIVLSGVNFLCSTNHREGISHVYDAYYYHIYIVRTQKETSK